MKDNEKKLSIIIDNNNNNRKNNINDYNFKKLINFNIFYILLYLLLIFIINLIII